MLILVVLLPTLFLVLFQYIMHIINFQCYGCFATLGRISWQTLWKLYALRCTSRKSIFRKSCSYPLCSLLAWLHSKQFYFTRARSICTSRSWCQAKFLVNPFLIQLFLFPHLYVVYHNPTFIIKCNCNINMLFLTLMHTNLIFEYKVLVKRNKSFQ